MLLPVMILAGIMSVITAPGLIAQYLEAKRARQSGDLNKDGSLNA